jgi:hypothetical protein
MLKVWCVILELNTIHNFTGRCLKCDTDFIGRLIGEVLFGIFASGATVSFK